MTAGAATLARRDVAVSSVRDGLVLLHSVDASASIGGMADDQLHADPGEVGYWVTRTACLELITLGVAVSTLALAIAQQGDAAAVRAGAARFCAEAEISPAVVLSSENYTRPVQSAISVSATGTAESALLVLRPPAAGTLLCTIGRPYDAKPTSETDILSISDLMRVIAHPLTREVIPVGSRGALNDLEALGVSYDLDVHPDSIRLPGGPGRLVLVLCDGPLDVENFTVVGRITGA